jgi:hypothetical protein
MLLNKFGFFLPDATDVSIAKAKHITAFCEQNMKFLCNVKAGGTNKSPGRFEVHIAVSIKSIIFWDMILYSVSEDPSATIFRLEEPDSSEIVVPIYQVT